MDLFTYAAAKAAGGSGGGSSITVDSILSDESENPVQNKVIKAALDGKAASSALPTKTSDLTNDAGYLTENDLGDYVKTEDLEDYATAADLATKQDLLQYDNAPTAGSPRMVKSGGIYSAIAQAIGSVSQFEYYLCGNGEYDPQTGVPTVQNPDTDHIYLVPTSGTNLNMYAYIGSSFTFLGTTEVDLSGYAKSSDLADVATSGSYEDLDDTPDIPKKTSDLINDAGFISSRTIYWTGGADSSTDTGPQEKAGGEHVYVYVRYLTEYDLEKFAQILSLSGTTLYMNEDGVTLDEIRALPDGSFVGANVAYDDETGDYSVIDTSKPYYLLMGFVNNNEYFLSFVSSIVPVEDIDWKIFSIGASYVTEDDLEDYAKNEEVVAALRYVPSISEMNTALAGKQNTLAFDNAPTANSSNPVKSGGVYTALAGKQAKLTFDSTPTSGSDNPVKSKGIYSALAGKQDTLTFDNAPTYGSSNPVKSGGVYSALELKADASAVPSNLVTGKNQNNVDKAYTIKISTSAPASGTLDNIITIVIPS